MNGIARKGMKAQQWQRWQLISMQLKSWQKPHQIAENNSNKIDCLSLESSTTSYANLYNQGRKSQKKPWAPFLNQAIQRILSGIQLWKERTQTQGLAELCYHPLLSLTITAALMSRESQMHCNGANFHSINSHQQTQCWSFKIIATRARACLWSLCSGFLLPPPWTLDVLSITAH